MLDQSQFMGTWLNMARTSFEATKRTMDSFAEQTEKAIEFTMQNAEITRNETRKMCDILNENNNNMRKMYVTAIEEGLKNLENQTSQGPKKGKG